MELIIFKTQEQAVAFGEARLTPVTRNLTKELIVKKNECTYCAGYSAPALCYRTADYERCTASPQYVCPYYETWRPALFAVPLLYAFAIASLIATAMWYWF